MQNTLGTFCAAVFLLAGCTAKAGKPRPDYFARRHLTTASRIPVGRNNLPVSGYRSTEPYQIGAPSQDSSGRTGAAVDTTGLVNGTGLSSTNENKANSTNGTR